MSAQDIAFNPLPEEDFIDGKNSSTIQYLQDKTSDFADGVEQDNWEEHATNKLSNALLGLDERSRHIIHARWLDSDKKNTLQTIANNYGISAERVRQLEKNAMKKLRIAIEA